MDGYFLRDEDIIGENPGEYRPFDLVDWKVSPTTDFSLESPELNFTAENLLDRVPKHDSTLEDTDSWLSVLNTKESWSETKTKLSQEGYLNEQVVPDQCHGVHQLDHKANSVAIQEIQRNFAEISKDSCTKESNCSPNRISDDVTMDNALEGDETPQNPNNSVLIVDHKEQVKCEQERFEIPPANILFNFNPLTEEKNVENIAKNRASEEPTDSVKVASVSSLSDTVQTIDVSEANGQLEIQNSERSNSEFVQPANVEKTKIKLQENSFAQQRSKQTREGNEIRKIRKEGFKLLTATKIPKCMMVDYKFDRSNKLPSFAETFCPDLSEKRRKTPRDIELPDVLQSADERSDKDEEMSIFIPESDSEYECSEPDVEEDERPSELTSQDSSGSDALPKIKSEVMDSESETSNKTQILKTEYVDTPSSMLAIDDELENFLVSSIVFNGTTQRSVSHLPDLSNNIGLIFKSEGLNEEHCIEPDYGNLFAKPELPDDSVKTCKQEQNTNVNVNTSYTTLNNYQGDLFNTALLGSERSWHEHNAPENMNPFYGSLLTNSTPSYVNHIGSRHFTNNIFRMGDPFMNNADLKTMTSLPMEIMQTDIDPFKFTTLVPKVEVLDSSMNYGFS